MELVILMIAFLMVGLLDRQRFNLWLAAGNFMTAISCYLTGQFLASGIILVFVILLVWWHFYRKKFEKS